MIELIEKHFRTTKFKSFIRQLHLYRFFRLKNRPSICFRHFYFLRDDTSNFHKIRRKLNPQALSKASKNRKIEQENERYQQRLSRLEQSYLEVKRKNSQIINKLQRQYELLSGRVEMEESKNQWYRRALTGACDLGLNWSKLVEPN